MIAYLTIIIALVGLLMWVLSSNAKVAEIGKILFAAGVFAFVFTLTGRTVKLF